MTAGIDDCGSVNSSRSSPAPQRSPECPGRDRRRAAPRTSRHRCCGRRSAGSRPQFLRRGGRCVEQRIHRLGGDVRRRTAPPDRRRAPAAAPSCRRRPGARQRRADHQPGRIGIGVGGQQRHASSDESGSAQPTGVVVATECTSPQQQGVVAQQQVDVGLDGLLHPSATGSTAAAPAAPAARDRR